VTAPGAGHAADAVLVLALGVDTALAVVDALTPVVLLNLLIFGPLVAAFRASSRTTAIVSVYALALAIYEGIPHGILGTGDHVVRCAAIAATGVLAVWGARQRERTARAEGRSALLARAGAVLGASLDVEDTLVGVARLVVPVAADRIAVDLIEDGAVRRVAEAHTGGGAADRPDHDARVADVARTGEPVLLDDTAILPLQARERTIGVLTLASAAAPPAAGSLKLAFARELAAECATAIDNARLHLELRASEEALRRSNDQLGAILGGVADGVLARDAAGQVVYANEAAAAVLRRPSPEALRRTPLDEVTRWVRLYDEGGSLVDAGDLPGARLLRGESAPDQLLRFQAIDTGAERWVLVKARAVRGPDRELRLAARRSRRCRRGASRRRSPTRRGCSPASS